MLIVASLTLEPVELADAEETSTLSFFFSTIFGEEESDLGLLVFRPGGGVRTGARLTGGRLGTQDR